MFYFFYSIVGQLDPRSPDDPNAENYKSLRCSSFSLQLSTWFTDRIQSRTKALLVLQGCEHQAIPRIQTKVAARFKSFSATVQINVVKTLGDLSMSVVWD